MSRFLRSMFAMFALALMPLAFANAQQVSVTAADPSLATQGTLSLDVTVTGNGFDNSAQVKFLVTGTTDPGGITVKKVNVRNSKRLIVTIDVADMAAVAKFDIEVALSNGRKGKGTTLFAVQRKPLINPAFLIDDVHNYKERVTTFAMDGTGLTTLVGPYDHAPNPQHIANAQWSPDGRSIVYWDRWSGLLVRADSRTGAVQSTRNTALALFPPRLDWSNTAVGSCGDLIVFSEATDTKADGFSREFDLFVAGSTLQQSAKVALSDDLDDGTVGNESDPDMLDPAWSRDGRFIVATNNSVRSTAIYRVNCTGPMNISVESETTLILDFGGPTSSIGDYSWSSSGRYIAMIAKTGTDMNLWVADLGEPDQLGYPNAAPPMYRLTGANRPFGTATDRFEGVSFSPTSTILAFAGRESGVRTINVGNCVAALAAASSVATDCAVTVVPADVNPHNIDWRPNWPTPLQ